MDYRCSLRAKRDGVNFVFGSDDQSNILYPLRKQRKLVFPYTPTIQFGNQVNYDEYSMTHSNYKYNAYHSSRPNEIVLTADFTAQTVEDAEYLLAVLSFFKSATKMYFGEQSSRSGTPPPVLHFNYMGEHAFNDVPVVITTHNYTLQPDVDYVMVEKFNTMVPTYVNMMITLEPNYNPNKVRKEFDLDRYREGKMFNKGYL